MHASARALASVVLLAIAASAEAAPKPSDVFCFEQPADTLAARLAGYAVRPEGEAPAGKSAIHLNRIVSLSKRLKYYAEAGDAVLAVSELTDAAPGVRQFRLVLCAPAGGPACRERLYRVPEQNFSDRNLSIMLTGMLLGTGEEYLCR